MKIQKQTQENGGEFFIIENDKRMAEMIYHLQDKTQMVIDHTQVDDSLKGKGIGKDLVAAGVNFARDNNLKIVPVCPFAKAEFDKHKDYEDVLAK